MLPRPARVTQTHKKTTHGKFTACIADLTDDKCDTMNIFFISISNQLMLHHTAVSPTRSDIRKVAHTD